MYDFTKCLHGNIAHRNTLTRVKDLIFFLIFIQEEWNSSLWKTAAVAVFHQKQPPQNIIFKLMYRSCQSRQDLRITLSSLNNTRSYYIINNNNNSIIHAISHNEHVCPCVYTCVYYIYQYNIPYTVVLFHM